MQSTTLLRQPRAPERRAAGGSPLARLLLGLIVAALSAPMVLITLALVWQIPGRLWPMDYPTVWAVRDAAGRVPDYPWSRVSKPKVHDIHDGRWFGFLPPDTTIETTYKLEYPSRTEWILEYYERELPKQGWRLVRTEPYADGTRAVYRRRAQGLHLVIPPPGDWELVYSFLTRVGPERGRSLYQFE